MDVMRIRTRIKGHRHGGRQDFPIPTRPLGYRYHGPPLLVQRLVYFLNLDNIFLLQDLHVPIFRGCILGSSTMETELILATERVDDSREHLAT